MKTVKINDKFPGASKGLTKTLDDATANDLIANKWAEEVKEKPKTAAQIKAEADADAKAKADAEAAEKAKQEADAKAKADAEAAERQTKEDKDANAILTK